MRLLRYTPKKLPLEGGEITVSSVNIQLDERVNYPQ